MNNKHKILNWALVIFWMWVIFYLSDQPSLKSSLPSNWDYFFRKMAHITEFGILTYLLIKSFIHHHFYYKNAIIFSVIIAISYAIFDEFHQRFIFERVGSIKDILIDTIGIVIVSIFYKKLK